MTDNFFGDKNLQGKSEDAPFEQIWLTVQQAMAYLKVSRETLRRYVRDGKLPAYKGERIVRFKREDLDKMLKKIDLSDKSAENVLGNLGEKIDI